jgi:hypothetical protein
LDAIFGFRDPNYYKEISLGITNSWCLSWVQIFVS